MQDLDRDLRRVVSGMVTTDQNVARNTLLLHRRYVCFTVAPQAGFITPDMLHSTDVTIIHSYLIAHGREEMWRVFNMWTGSNAILTPEIFTVTLR